MQTPDHSLAPAASAAEFGAECPGPAAAQAAPQAAAELGCVRGEASAESRVLQVEHVTRIDYSAPVEEAQHVACLRPLSDRRQQLLAHELDMQPAPAHQREMTDAFGNARQQFSALPPHRVLTLTARSRVRLHSLPTDIADSPSWESVAARLAYRAGAPFEPAAEFAQASPRVPRLPALRAWALQEFTAGRPLAEAAVALMARLHTEFEFDPNATEVNTPLAAAFSQRRGVCQDFSHIMLGALRALGLAARYVSGYLLTAAPAGRERLIGADASHAWLAVWCPVASQASGHIGLELDPTNNCIPGFAHVRLAYGRDYDDVSPLRGVIRGGGGHQVCVQVTTTEIPELSTGTEFACPA